MVRLILHLCSPGNIKMSLKQYEKTIETNTAQHTFSFLCEERLRNDILF